MNGVAGIVSYGAYVPHARIQVGQIAAVWGDESVSDEAYGVRQKSVALPDEDVVTMSVEAARLAFDRSDAANVDQLGAIYVGSESHPYAVKPTGTIVQAALGAPERLTMADYEFACKAGTAAIQTGVALVCAGMAKQVLAIGADTSQGAPRNALEYSTGCGAGAVVLGNEQVIATLNHTESYTSDTPDFWRREGQIYPSHGERFTGEPAYFRHVLEASHGLFETTGTTAKDFDYAVFHQPNGKFPVAVAKKLGFTKEQYETGLLAPTIGNTYSGAAIIGLCAILDVAKPGDRIFMCGYGSGAGADAFDFTVTEHILKVSRTKELALATRLESTTNIDYATYAKWRGKIVRGA